MTKQYCSFSEAIREGAKLRPQAFGAGILDGGTCAYGAGVEAICGSLEPAIYQAVNPYQLFPYLRSGTECPGCGDTKVDFLAAIYHINDMHQWTREAIADWLYAEEEKLGFVTITTDETLKTPEAGRGDSAVTQEECFGIGLSLK